jgi:putative endonuclease
MISIGDIFQHVRMARRGAAAPHLEIGELGEKMAAGFLQDEGYRVVALNFTTPIGYSRTGRPLTGEIDIIAYDESSLPFTLAFIEVKTRTKTEIAAPESAVDRRKQRRIARAARIYRRLLAVENEPYRYDVVSIVITPNGEPRPTLLRGYFSERSFVENR